jgi:ApbE superfamily uncharacterized protein (UPF0280 family)
MAPHNIPRPSLFHRLLPDGRLHLQEGPIDLIIEAFGAAEEVRRAYDAAAACFEDVLPGLVAELPALKQPVTERLPVLQGPVAQRMAAACRRHSTVFVTPMAAVAGAVADHVLAAMTAAAELPRAYVNDGGDIALHLAPGERLACGMVARIHEPRLDGRVVIAAEMPVRGIATSGRATQGQGGRSFSLGIADAVTVFARSAAKADVAATLVANTVDLPGHPAVQRLPACEIDPESDLGQRAVTVAVGPLTRDEVVAALTRGRLEAESMRAAGLIEAAVLFLDGQAEVVGGSPLAASRLSSRGLSPGPIALAVQEVVEVVPLRIATLDQPDLPGARPLLHGLLPLDRAGDFLVGLDKDQTRDALSPCEAGADALPVFPNAAGDVVGDTNVEGAVLAAGEDVNIVGHRPALTPLGPGDKPRDDSGVYNRNEIIREDA